MLNELQSGVCELFFKKLNGAIRQMICTLDARQSPELQKARIMAASTPDNKSISPTVIAVWDVEKMGWRSFRVSSVIYFRKQGVMTGHGG